MPLEEKILDLLEAEIEMARQGIPAFKQKGMDTEFRKKWKLVDENEFSLGWALGSIQSGFLMHYGSVYQKFPSDDEVMEATICIAKRVKELKEFSNAV